MFISLIQLAHLFKKESVLTFHTKDIPGSHIILFTEGKELTETAIFDAAAAAAYHSKGKSS